jgi:hypothetical protein
MRYECQFHPSGAPVNHRIASAASRMNRSVTDLWRIPRRQLPDSSWTGKEPADWATTADLARTECVFHHLQSYGRKSKDPVGDIVRASHAGCGMKR